MHKGLKNFLFLQPLRDALTKRFSFETYTGRLPFHLVAQSGRSRSVNIVMIPDEECLSFFISKRLLYGEAGINRYCEIKKTQRIDKSAIIVKNSIRTSIRKRAEKKKRSKRGKLLNRFHVDLLTF
jgi:hypothetical protein